MQHPQATAAFHRILDKGIFLLLLPGPSAQTGIAPPKVKIIPPDILPLFTAAGYSILPLSQRPDINYVIACYKPVSAAPIRLYPETLAAGSDFFQVKIILNLYLYLTRLLL